MGGQASGGAGGEVDLKPDYGFQAVMATRPRFNFVYRLVGRLLQVVALDGGAHRSSAWRWLLLAFVGLDIGLWAFLRDPGRSYLKTRTLIDALDIATWSLAPYPPGMAYDVAVFIGFPLALEAGFRLQWAGFAVPAVSLGVTAFVRLLAGSPVLPFSFLWLVIAVIAGVMLRRNDQRLRRQVYQDWSRHRAADSERAFLAGQNSVAMGASSTVDELEKVVPILGPVPTGSALYELADAWKAQLSAATSEQAVYLGMAVLRWTAEHNRHPDLSSHVHFKLREGQGTMLLTGTQTRALHHRLSALPLRGEVAVELDDSRVVERPPGGAFRLHVGHQSIDVPADARRPPRPCDPAPLAFVLAAVCMARGTLAIGEQVPILPTAVCVLVALAAARWAHLRLLRLGLRARHGIIVAAIGVGVVHVTLASLTMQHFFNPAGMTNYPGMGSFLLLALIGGVYFHGTGPTDRWLIAFGALLLAVLSWFLHPAPQHFTHLLITLLFPASLYIMGLRLGQELDHAEVLYFQDLRSTDDAAMSAAFDDGRDAVVGLVQRAHDDARTQLAASRATLDPADYAATHQKLLEVHRRLRTLTSAAASSWSTTTT